MTRFGFVLLSVFAALALVVLLRLGTWQVQRLEWKENLIATVQSRIDEAPETLSQIEARFMDTLDVDYFPVEVTGRFVHGYEAHYLNTHKGAVGWNVYTPLELEDGRWLFVNRGFIPDRIKDPSARLAGQIEGVVSFRGLSRNAPAGKPSSILPDNALEKNEFYWRDIQGMAANAGKLMNGDVLPFFVDAGEEATPDFGVPLGGITRISFPNNHLGYAITWYGLAFALVGVYGAFVLKRRRTKDD